MPKIIAPKQYKGYLSEWDMLGLQPMAGITLLGMAKGLKKTGFPTQAREYIYNLIRKKPGIKQAKEVIKEIKQMETYDAPIKVGRREYSPSYLLGFNDPTRGVGLRKFGYKHPSGRGSSLKDNIETFFHEVFGHEAHGKLVRQALRKRYPEASREVLEMAGGWKMKRVGKAEDIAEAIAADIMSQARPAWRVLQSNPEIYSKSVSGIAKTSKIRAQAILKKAGKVEKPAQGFLSGNIKARLLLPHLKP